MITNLNYHHLFYFKVIATEGSIVKAAKKLHLGQSTLSAQLKTLEEQINTQLFQRQKKQLILTDAGKVVLDYATGVFRLGSEMLEVLKDGTSATKVHLQLGLTNAVPKHIASTVIRQALHHQSCTITVHEGHYPELVQELLAHRIDLLLSNQSPNFQKDQKGVAKSVLEMEVSIYGHKKFKGLIKNFPHSLNQQPFVIPLAQNQLRSKVENYFQLNNLTMNVVTETEDTSLQKILATQGEGLLPITEIAVQSLVEKGELIKIGRLDKIRETLYLVSANRRIQNPVAYYLFNHFKLKT
jgi:LysR family transcriptional activator of nhaA